MENVEIVAVVVAIGVLSVIHKYVYFESVDPIVNRIKAALRGPGYFYTADDDINLKK